MCSQGPPYPTGSWDYLCHGGISDPDLSNTTHVTNQHNSPCPLEIAIVGAGVGGLAAAIALKNSGHDVTIYENAPALSEIGAGIQIPPNSARLLYSWGLEEGLKTKSVRPNSLLWKRWQDGRAIARTKYKPDFERWFGASYFVTHRAHLHEVLHEKVVTLEIPLHLGSTVEHYNLEEASFQLRDGHVIRADLIVAADGVKSLARRTILGNDEKGLRNHGIAAYRASVPMERIRADPCISQSVDFESLNLWAGDQAHVMSYTMSGGNTLNLVITVPEPLPPSEWDSTDSGSVSKMCSYFDGWDPVLVSRTSKWPIQDIEFTEQWSSAKKTLVLLGDSAHAMLPFMSIGAAMAVEDASALAKSLSVISSKAQLKLAISVYEDARLERVRLMHEASYRHAYTVHLGDGPEQRARDTAMADEVAGVHFIQSPNQWSDPTTQLWAYGHDVDSAVAKAWRARNVDDFVQKL